MIRHRNRGIPVGILKLFRKRQDPRKEELRAALKECDVFFRDEIAWPEIRGIIERQLERPLSPNLVFEKPKHLHRYLTLVLWRLVTEKLTSGELHIYRGVLSGRGHSYRSIAEELASHMIAYGDLRGSQSDEELTALDEGISEVG